MYPYRYLVSCWSKTTADEAEVSFDRHSLSLTECRGARCLYHFHIKWSMTGPVVFCQGFCLGLDQWLDSVRTWLHGVPSAMHNYSSTHPCDCDSATSSFVNEVGQDIQSPPVFRRSKGRVSSGSVSLAKGRRRLIPVVPI